MPDGQILFVYCVSCKAKYNVGALKPGTKFRCQKCQAINVVPQVAGTGLAGSPPKPPAKISGSTPLVKLHSKRPIIGAQTRPGAPVRPLTAKGMSIKPIGLSPKRLAANQPPQDEGFLPEDEGIPGVEIKEKKSKTLLFIGIGVGIIIIITVIIFLSGGRPAPRMAGEKTDKKAEAGTVEKDKPADKTEAPKEPAKPAEGEKKGTDEKPAGK